MALRVRTLCFPYCVRGLARAAFLAALIFPFSVLAPLDDPPSHFEPSVAATEGPSPLPISRRSSTLPVPEETHPALSPTQLLADDPGPSASLTPSDGTPRRPNDTPTALPWAETTAPRETPPPIITASPMRSETLPPSGTASPDSWETPTESSSPTGTAFPPTPSDTPTGTPTPTPTLTATSESPQLAQGDVLIHEVAWSGTIASASDEWIELHNPGPDPIDLTGWRLSDGGDISFQLGGVLPPSGYFLLERTDDTTVADVAADQIYTGSLSNSGETLTLTDPTGATIDTANGGGGPWPAGSAANRASMERRGPLDIPENWGTAYGPGLAHDSAGNPIVGTPRAPNSSPIPTSTPSPPATSVSPGAVLINEVAWSGTVASANDEWIELHNPGGLPMDLAGWHLGDSGDLAISLTGTIPAFGFYLLERTDDTTIADLAADQIYSGGLSNAGEALTLTDSAGAVVDTANSGGGSWPAGEEDSRRSMERRGLADIHGNWGSFTGYFGNGKDAAGGPIQGSPRAPNSLLFPTPSPTWIPGRVVINEVLPRPRHDWEGKGGVTSDDEFIELVNLGPGDVRLEGWTLDDAAVGGAAPYRIPSRTLAAGQHAVFFRTRTNISLNDVGDSVRLEAPNGRLIDKVVYLRGSAVNLAYGRIPDASNQFSYCLWPTPGAPNELFFECRPSPPPRPRIVVPPSAECSAAAVPFWSFTGLGWTRWC